MYAITDSAERAALAADHDFFEALKGGDTASLDRVLNDDFVIVDVMSGGITTKEALVSAIRERQLLFETIEVAERETLVRFTSRRRCSSDERRCAAASAKSPS